MQNSLFSTALTPIHSRSRLHNTRKSVARGDNRYPRSSTPLRDVNTSSGTNTQRIAQKKKSSGTGHSADITDRKRKSSAAVIGPREKVAKHQVNTQTAGKSDSLTSRTVSGRSRVIDSLAGELQQQKREELSKRRGSQRKAGHSRDTDDENKQLLHTVKVKQRMYNRWKPVAPESIKIAMNALQAAVGDINLADSIANSAELKQLHNEIKQELQKLKVPGPLESYSEISELTKTMENEVQEAEHDVDCLSTEVADIERCIKQTARKLKSFQQHNASVMSSISEEE